MPRRLLLLFALPPLLLLCGTVGYRVIEGWAWFDALYMTVITLTTVGYFEVHELSLHGRIFTVALLLVGVFVLFTTATEVVRGLLTGELGQLLRRRRMKRTLQGLHDHVIIAGYGRVGRFVAQAFAAQRVPHVVIDRLVGLEDRFASEGGVYLPGDATSDETLRRAGIERARALITVVPSDADNLFVTMSARLLNEKLFIVARAEAEDAQSKLTRAGANRVIAPFVLGGQQVVQAVLRPNVLDFIDLATSSQQLELQLEEAKILPGSPLAGVTLAAAKLRDELRIVVVAIKRAGGKMIYAPAADDRLEAGDTLIVLGPRAQLDVLERRVKG